MSHGIREATATGEGEASLSAFQGEAHSDASTNVNGDASQIQRSDFGDIFSDQICLMDVGGEFTEFCIIGTAAAYRRMGHNVSADDVLAHFNSLYDMELANQRPGRAIPKNRPGCKGFTLDEPTEDLTVRSPLYSLLHGRTTSDARDQRHKAPFIGRCNLDKINQDRT
ncbi:hypothetical protein D918_05477 [Trichuris suis]|nr:hypothetical protein D918_05477 [Trichuris suis]